VQYRRRSSRDGVQIRLQRNRRRGHQGASRGNLAAAKRALGSGELPAYEAFEADDESLEILLAQVEQMRAHHVRRLVSARQDVREMRAHLRDILDGLAGDLRREIAAARAC
jgi:hypothetical protein